MSSRRARERFRREKIAYMEALHAAQAENERATRLEAMTKAQLIEYAEANGINVDKSAKKADIISALRSDR